MVFLQSPGPLLIVGHTSEHLVSALAASKKAKLIRTTLETFPDTEMQPVIHDQINGETIFVVQATPTADSLVSLLLTIDAAKGAGANKVVVLIPYFGYARQDRRFGQSSYGASLVARMLEAAGADKIYLVDPHNPAVTGFFRIPATCLDPVQQFVTAWESAELDLEEMVVVTPDAGSFKRALAYCRAIGQEAPIVMFKERTGPDHCRILGVAGSVQNRPVMLVDDMVSSGGTLLQASQLLQEKGATAVYATATHLVTTRVLDQLNNSAIRHLFVSDSLNHQVSHERVTAVTLGTLLAEAIDGYQAGREASPGIAPYPHPGRSFISGGKVHIAG